LLSIVLEIKEIYATETNPIARMDLMSFMIEELVTYKPHRQNSAQMSLTKESSFQIPPQN